MKNLNRRLFLKKSLSASAGAIWLSGHTSAARKNAPPNIVLIVSDDQGYADASCYDHPKEVRTPNIDRLARRGVRLTNAYASAQTKKPLHEALFFCDGSDQWAVRAGKWKLLSRKNSLELYNLDNDIGENNNLASKEPELLRRLKELYSKWRAQMGEPLSTQKRRTKKIKKNRSKQK